MRGSGACCHRRPRRPRSESTPFPYLFVPVHTYQYIPVSSSSSFDGADDRSADKLSSTVGHDSHEQHGDPVSWMYLTQLAPLARHSFLLAYRPDGLLPIGLPSRRAPSYWLTVPTESSLSRGAPFVSSHLAPHRPRRDPAVSTFSSPSDVRSLRHHVDHPPLPYRQRGRLLPACPMVQENPIESPPSRPPV